MNQDGPNLVIKAQPPPPLPELKKSLSDFHILHVGERIAEKQYVSTMIIGRLFFMFFIYGKICNFFVMGSIYMKSQLFIFVKYDFSPIGKMSIFAA